MSDPAFGQSERGIARANKPKERAMTTQTENQGFSQSVGGQMALLTIGLAVLIVFAWYFAF